MLNYRETSSTLTKKFLGRPLTETGYCSCEGFNWTISTGLCKITCGCLMFTWSDCSENPAPWSETVPLRNCFCTRTESKWFSNRQKARRRPIVDLCWDEAQFQLSGAVDKQNCRYSSEETPRELHQRPFHNSKLSVWCAISNVAVWGPYFENFEEADLMAPTVRFL